MSLSVLIFDIFYVVSIVGLTFLNICETSPIVSIGETPRLENESLVGGPPKDL